MAHKFGRAQVYCLWQQVSLGFVNILNAPIASLMIIICMACALFFTVFACDLLENLGRTRGVWNKSAEITLYLKKRVTAQDATNLMTQLSNNNLITHITLITPEHGLKYFVDNPTLHKAVTDLKINPLPYVVTFSPKLNSLPESEAQMLLQQLEGYPEVAQVKADLDWLKQSHQWLGFMHNFVILLLVVLGINALLVLCGGSYFTMRYFVGRKDLVHNVCAYQLGWCGFFSGFLAIFLLRFLVIILQQHGIQLLMLSTGCELFMLSSSVVLTFASARLVE